MKYSANSVWENKDQYDIAVVGAGHAGCEAALACARLGFKTVMFTVSVDSIALMPCNPNIRGKFKRTSCKRNRCPRRRNGKGDRQDIYTVENVKSVKRSGSSLSSVHRQINPTIAKRCGGFWKNRTILISVRWK